MCAAGQLTLLQYYSMLVTTSHANAKSVRFVSLSIEALTLSCLRGDACVQLAPQRRHAAAYPAAAAAPARHRAPA
jgi:hypothetical protein